MSEKRVYTAVSGKAVQGLQRLISGREIYVSSPSANGYTVVTRDAKIGAFSKSTGKGQVRPKA